MSKRFMDNSPIYFVGFSGKATSYGTGGSGGTYGGGKGANYNGSGGTAASYYGGGGGGHAYYNGTPASYSGATSGYQGVAYVLVPVAA